DGDGGRGSGRGARRVVLGGQSSKAGAARGRGGGPVRGRSRPVRGDERAPGALAGAGGASERVVERSGGGGGLSLSREARASRASVVAGTAVRARSIGGLEGSVSPGWSPCGASDVRLATAALLAGGGTFARAVGRSDGASASGCEGAAGCGDGRK